MRTRTAFTILSLLSIAQCTFQASAMSALRTWWQGKNTQQELNEQLRHATLEVYSNKVKPDLDGMRNAISQANLPSFEQHKKQLLELIEQNPDVLWHTSTKWNGNKNIKLIDAVAVFGYLQDRANFAQNNIAIPHNAVPMSSRLFDRFFKSMQDTYRMCLLLSNRSILEPSAGQSYLAQLVREVEATSDIYVALPLLLEGRNRNQKLRLSLEYLADAYRHTLYTDAAEDTIPNDLNRLITTDFLHGVHPRLQKNFAKEATQLEMRRNSSKKNEADIFFKNIIVRRALKREESCLHFPDNPVYRLLRGFAHAGLIKGNLTTKAHRSLLPTTISLYSGNRLLAVITAGIRMMRDIMIMAMTQLALGTTSYEYKGHTYVRLPGDHTSVSLGSLIGSMFFGGMLTFGIHTLANCCHTILDETLAQEKLYRTFSKRWKKLTQEVNNARLDFEQDCYRPNIIPAPSLVAQLNNLELE